MHYFHKVSHVTQNRLVVFLVYLFFAGFTNKNADAQDIGTEYSQIKAGYERPKKCLFNETEDLMGFFFFVQEAYFSSHFSYSNDLETVCRYGETLSPFMYRQIMDSITNFRVECGNLEMTLFYDNDTLAAFKRNFNCQDVYINMRLRDFVRLFDDKDLVIDDTTVFKEYCTQKRELLVNLYEKCGYDVEMVMLPLDEYGIEKKEYPLTVLFVYDSSGLIVHPLFSEYECQIDNDFKRNLAHMAGSICSKYNASKIIFSSQIMCRNRQIEDRSFCP